VLLNDFVLIAELAMQYRESVPERWWTRKALVALEDFWGLVMALTIEGVSVPDSKPARAATELA
jgi:hypothetical protein